MRTSCRTSQRVIVQTDVMQRCVAAEFAIPIEKIDVVKPDVDDLPRPTVLSKSIAAMSATWPGKRLLYVGNQSSYKNTAVLTRAVTIMRKSCSGLKLFLTWPPDAPDCQQDGVVGLGYLQGAELRQAYELADALVMPSLVETVGLPMLEAMNVGIPVIAADRPYAHDVCEDAAVFFDPLDASALAHRITRVLCDEDLRRDLVCRGRDIIRKRRAARPYERMVDIVAKVVSARDEVGNLR
jgi:glycosyltransferase involved in cell wall biosynthesis